MFERLQFNYRILFEGQPAPIFYKYFYPTGNNHDVLWDLFNYSRGLKKDKARDDEQYEIYRNMVDTSDNSSVDLYELDLRNFLNAVYADTGRTRNAGITAIPSSNANKVNRVTEIIRTIMQHTPGVYADLTNNIYRVKNKDAAHGGGNRSIEGNIATLGSRRPYEIRDLDLIIVVDDIVTSGSSFRAMYEFLRRTGFQGQVINFAYARHFPSEVVETYYKYNHEIEYEAFPGIQDLQQDYDNRPAWNNEGNEIFGVIYDLDQTLIDDPIRDIEFEDTLCQSAVYRSLPYRFYDGVKELMELPIASAIVSNRPMKQLEKLFEYSEVDATLAFPKWDRIGLLRPVFSFPEEQRGKFTTRFYKPHSSGVARACYHLENDYDLAGCRIVGVGNTMEDIMAYKAFGMEAILALWGVPPWLRDSARKKWQADYIFENADDLRQWLAARMYKPNYYEMGRQAEDRDKREACKYYDLALQNGQSTMEAVFRYAFLISSENPEKAKELYKLAIDAGDEYAATNNLALLIESENPDHAQELYERSITAGNKDVAARNLALLIIEKKPIQAVELLRTAAENGNASNLESDLEPLIRAGVSEAASLYRELGEGSDDDKARTIATLAANSEPERAKTLLEEAIAAGDEAFATRSYALLIRDEDPERAIDYLARSAEAGNTAELLADLTPMISAGTQRAIQLYKEAVIAKDGKKAFGLAVLVAGYDKELAKELYGRAIAAGDEYASTGNLANLIVNEEPDRAKELYERAIAAGEERYATNNLANLIAQSDPKAAIALYERAIAAGDNYYAPRNLALKIIADEPDRAVDLLRKAAENGNKSNLAKDLEPVIRGGSLKAIRLYESMIVADDGVKAGELANLIATTRPDKAESLYRRAIAAGDERFATFDLAVFLERQHKNPSESEALYRRAMAAGDEIAAPNNLGALIVSSNSDEARSLFERAMAAGDTVYATCNLAHTYISEDAGRSYDLYQQSLDSADETEAKLGMAYLLKDSQPGKANDLMAKAISAPNIKESVEFCIKTVAAYDSEAARAVAKYFQENGYQDAWVSIAKQAFGDDYKTDKGIVQLGTNPETKERITWLVLGYTNDGLLLLSQYVLCKQAFVEKASEATWKDSDVRTWLNGEFLADYFSFSERESIAAHPGVDDKIFCLTNTELDNYAHGAIDESAIAAKDFNTHRLTKWWLRPEEGGTLSAPCIDENGKQCWILALLEQGVRPALICKI